MLIPCGRNHHEILVTLKQLETKNQSWAQRGMYKGSCRNHSPSRCLCMATAPCDTHMRLTHREPPQSWEQQRAGSIFVLFPKCVIRQYCSPRGTTAQPAMGPLPGGLGVIPGKPFPSSLTSIWKSLISKRKETTHRVWDCGI